MATYTKVVHTLQRWRYWAQNPYGFYLLLGLAVLGPMVGRGYILTLDMAFTPHLRLPDTVTSSYLFHALLHVANLVIPSDILQKVMLLIILTGSGLGMHRLYRHLEKPGQTKHTLTLWGAYLAGTLYMVNPYTYSRFMAGQYAVLLGYACLPFFARACLQFLSTPGRRTSLVLAAWTTATSIVSIHTIGLLVILSFFLVGQSLWQQRQNPTYLRQVTAYGSLSLLIMLAASSYWLVPLLLGHGKTAQAINNFTAGDRQAFATLGTSVVEKLGNIAHFQGFWAEGRGLYLLPQDRMPAWGGATLLAWICVFIGIKTMKRERQNAVRWLGGSMFVAAFLAAGIGTDWLSGHIGLFAGYREPHKFVGLVALGFCLFFGRGATVVLQRASKRTIYFSVWGTLVVLLPLLWTRPMFWGFDGQLVPRKYPADWFAANQQLNRSAGSYETLFLPWHLYMHFRFAGRIIVNPADQFFDQPVIMSNDPEIGRASPNTYSPAQKALSRLLPQAKTQTNLGAQLAPWHIKYVMLAKEFDVEKYSYLDKQQDLRLVFDSATLRLYQNEALKGEK